MTFEDSFDSAATSIDPTDDNVWEEVGQRIDRFSEAWRDATEAPPLQDYLPPEDSAAFLLTLGELVKIDLEHRVRSEHENRLIEDYAAQYDQLCKGGEIPCDLLYEEYHIRRQCGETVQVSDYIKRFPQQASQLKKLLDMEDPLVSTSLSHRRAKVEFKPGDSVDDFDLLTRLGEGAFPTSIP